MKGDIKPDHIAVNKYQFRVGGLMNFIAVEISGLEDELVTIELPDRTVGTGGFRKASEFTLKMPMHHDVEVALFELWYRESQDPVVPTYKKPCTLKYRSITGSNERNYTLIGVFPKKRKLPDLDMKNDGDLATIEFTMSVDDVIPL